MTSTLSMNLGMIYMLINKLRDSIAGRIRTVCVRRDLVDGECLMGWLRGGWRRSGRKEGGVGDGGAGGYVWGGDGEWKVWRVGWWEG